jgi:hypothetical protein
VLVITLLLFYRHKEQPHQTGIGQEARIGKRLTQLPDVALFDKTIDHAKRKPRRSLARSNRPRRRTSGGCGESGVAGRH